MKTTPEQVKNRITVKELREDWEERTYIQQDMWMTIKPVVSLVRLSSLEGWYDD